MKRIFFFCIIFYLFTAFKCDCDDCQDCDSGGLEISRYSLVNKLSERITVSIHSQNIVTEISLNPMDTSISWDRILYFPRGGISKFFTIDGNGARDSFPYYSDSILIKVDDQVIGKFFQKDDYTSLEWETSIYNDGSYTIIPPEKLPANEVVSGSIQNIVLYYYSLDSTNLKLN